MERDCGVWSGLTVAEIEQQFPEDWAGFEKAAQALDTASADLASVAASGDKQKVAAAFGNLGKACGGCHKPYRVKQ